MYTRNIEKVWHTQQNISPSFFLNKIILSVNFSGINENFVWIRKFPDFWQTFYNRGWRFCAFYCGNMYLFWWYLAFLFDFFSRRNLTTFLVFISVYFLTFSSIINRKPYSSSLSHSHSHTFSHSLSPSCLCLCQSLALSLSSL